MQLWLGPSRQGGHAALLPVSLSYNDEGHSELGPFGLVLNLCPSTLNPVIKIVFTSPLTPPRKVKVTSSSRSVGHITIIPSSLGFLTHCYKNRGKGCPVSSYYWGGSWRHCSAAEGQWIREKQTWRMWKENRNGGGVAKRAIWNGVENIEKYKHLTNIGDVTYTHLSPVDSDLLTSIVLTKASRTPTRNRVLIGPSPKASHESWRTEFCPSQFSLGNFNSPCLKLSLTQYTLLVLPKSASPEPWFVRSQVKLIPLCSLDVDDG